MYPAIIVSPDFRISTWGLLISLAALSVLWLGRVNAPARGLRPGLVEGAWPWLIFGGLLGAHLYYLLAVDRWPLHRVPLVAVVNIFSGTAVQGGILGGLLAASVYLKREGGTVLTLCDVLSPAGALAQAITRIGCFAAGCCYGRKTNSFLGVVFSSPLAYPKTPRGVPLHPAQLYEAILDLCLAVFLQKELKDPGRPGKLFALYVMGASFIRFFVQFFRGDDEGHLAFGMAHSQFLAVALFLSAAWMHNMLKAEVA